MSKRCRKVMPRVEEGKLGMSPSCQQPKEAVWPLDGDLTHAILAFLPITDAMRSLSTCQAFADMRGRSFPWDVDDVLDIVMRPNEPTAQLIEKTTYTEKKIGDSPFGRVINCWAGCDVEVLMPPPRIEWGPLGRSWWAFFLAILKKTRANTAYFTGMPSFPWHMVDVSTRVLHMSMSSMPQWSIISTSLMELHLTDMEHLNVLDCAGHPNLLAIYASNVGGDQLVTIKNALNLLVLFFTDSECEAIVVDAPKLQKLDITDSHGLVDINLNIGGALLSMTANGEIDLHVFSGQFKGAVIRYHNCEGEYL